MIVSLPGFFFTLLGFLSGCAVLTWAAHRRGFHWLTMLQLMTVAVCGGALGAYGLQSLVLPAGRTILGGLLGGWILVELWKRQRGLRRSTGDLFALAMPAAEFWGRLGCYFNQCCYGIPWDGPWAVVQHGCPRHPTQLYSSLLSLLIFSALWMQFRRPQIHEGRLFLQYLVASGTARLVVEAAREGPAPVLGLRPSQWLCLVIIAIGWRGLKKGTSALPPRTLAAK